MRRVRLRRSLTCWPTWCGCSAKTTPRTLASRENLALWREEAGDVAGTAQAWADVLASHARVLGEDDPRTLASRVNFDFWQGRVERLTSNTSLNGAET